MRARQILVAGWIGLGLTISVKSRAANVAVTVSTPMPPPRWALLERQLLAENVPACHEFFKRYFDGRGYLQCFVRWGANDGPDDAFENFNRWPELHALGASDEIRTMFLSGWEGMLKQYAEARTIEVPIAREGMYYKDFCVQADWMHLGEGLQLFNRMGLSAPMEAKYQERARRFAGFYINEDPEARNYDPKHRIIRSMLNGSKGPMLREATAIDWVGDPFDVTGFVALHGEHTFAQFLAHYREYTNVAGDNCLNLVATTLPLNAYMLAHEEKYKQWILEYMDAWLERMQDNHGVIPSYVDLEGKVGGPDGKWWGSTYGWGFSPVNPVSGRRENRHRIPRALVGFNNALWVSGDQKYVDAWRNMINAVNANARTNNGRVEYPTMHGEQGWYGWQAKPWDIGAVEIYYWSMKPDDLKRVPRNDWIAFLEGKDSNYPEVALERDLRMVQSRLDAIRRDGTPPEKRLSDNMLDLNPASTASLVQLMWGGLPPGVDGGLINARLRYFDPARKRAGIPADVAALVSRLTDRETTVTLVNLNKSKARTVVLQGGAYGEHQLESVTIGEKSTAVNSAWLAVQLEPGCG
ncbi:MAG TPA: hypothetical protein VGR78_08495, partial [Verrucomicrobiae bacterium]|nr:hypothetical protein [Verrucomicrobiae bacterium]